MHSLCRGNVADQSPAYRAVSKEATFTERGISVRLTHRPAIYPGSRGLDSLDSGTVQPLEVSNPVVQIPPLLPPEVRCEEGLGTFSAELQDETDLDALDNELVGG